MRNHFSYLTDEPSNDFFQKLAVAKSGVPARAVVAAPMAKTASASPFEKIAGRLDRDLAIIRDIGPRGVNAGMMKRADAYVDHLLNQEDLSAEEFGEVFDKIAAAAIMGDLEAAYQQLTVDVPQELHHVVEQTLAKIGHDLTSLALLEKEAGVLKFLGRVLGHGGGGELKAGLNAAKGVAKGAVKDVGIALKAPFKGIAEGAKAVGRGVAKPFLSAGERIGKRINSGVGEVRAARHEAIMDAPEKIQKNLDMQRNPDAVASLKKSLGKANERKRAHLGYEKDPPAGAAPTPAAEPTPPRAPEPAKAGEAKVVKAEGERAKASGDAQEAATPKTKAPAEPKPAGQEPAAAKAPAAGTEPKPPADPPAAVKATDAFKKWSESGWAALSPAEKGAMIRAGVVGAVGYRAVTGKGAVTGGEGLV